MKTRVLLLVLVAAAVGYLLGTEKGRGQRDQIIVKIRERRGTAAPTDPVEQAEETIDVTDATTSQATDVAETVSAGAD